MTVRGTVRGASIGLEETLPFPIGQEVTVNIEPLDNGSQMGSPAAALEAVRRPPHISSEDAAELERAIEGGKLPGREKGIFDDFKNSRHHMDYLLDTNAVSDLIREQPRVEGRLNALPQGSRVMTCTIVRGEVLYGLRRLPQGKRLALLEEKAGAVLV